MIIDRIVMDSLCKCVWLPSPRIRILHFKLWMCWQKTYSYASGCILKSERQLGNWSGNQSLPLCICAFVWWSSKTSIAIPASHWIGLLYKNTPARILQSCKWYWGSGGGWRREEEYIEYSSEICSYVCFLNSWHTDMAVLVEHVSNLDHISL